MPKYHINLKTGLTSKCNAIKGRCPFGDSTNHFESEAIANEIAQKILETKHGLSKTLNVKGLSEREKLDLVIKDIDARGGKVFYVGGYVRDKILGKENKGIRGKFAVQKKSFLLAAESADAVCQERSQGGLEGSRPNHGLFGRRGGGKGERGCAGA